MSTEKPERTKCKILAAVVAFFILSLLLSGWKDFWLFVDAHQLTATVIDEGLKPGTFEYEYTINGVQYTGFGHRGGGLPDNTHIGGQALVYVSSSHPSLSSAGMPRFSLLGYSVILILLLWAEFSLLKTVIRF